MKKINIQWVAETAIIAALYAALTWLLAPISYGAVQFRISEILVLLVVFKPSYCVALILGCFIANTTSSLGWWDMVFGTLATAVAVLPMIKIKKLWIAAALPVISNGIIVALELYFALSVEPIWLSMLTVALGEAVVLYCIGIPVMISIAKNEALVERLGLSAEQIQAPKFFTLANALAIAAAVLGVVLFIAYPLYSGTEITDGESVKTYYSALTTVKSNPWTVLLAVAPFLYGVCYLVFKNKIRLISCLVWILLTAAVFIGVGAVYREALSCGYYYGYTVYILMLIAVIAYGYRKDSKKFE